MTEKTEVEAGAIVVQQPYHGGRFIIAYKGASLDGMSYPTAEAAQAELDAIRAALNPPPPAGDTGEVVAWRAVAHAETGMGAIVGQALDYVVIDADRLYGKGQWDLQALVVSADAPDETYNVSEAHMLGPVEDDDDAPICPICGGRIGMMTGLPVFCEEREDNGGECPWELMSDEDEP